jgi:hypothetical protein
VDYRKLKRTGNYFLRNGGFSGDDLVVDFDSLETTTTYFLYSNHTTLQLFSGTGCKIAFGKNFVLTSSHTDFISRQVANTTAFTLEFRGLQNILVAPTNFLRSLNTENIDLRIRVGSYGVDAVNNVWLSKVWRSVTLIDENGNEI